MKQFFLLLDILTYIPLPKKLIAPREELPRAMRFLPLVGLLNGLLIFLAARLLVIMPASGAAAVLLGFHLLLGGAKMLRDLIVVADGLSVDPLYGPEADKKQLPTNPDNEKELDTKARHFNAGRAGLVWGGVWLLSLYLIFLLYLSSSVVSDYALITAPVVSCWLMDWVIYYFYATPPAWLHRNFSRRDFALSAVLALMSILLFSSVPLYMAVLVSFLGVYLFGTYRQRTVGGLDDVCYGAACAWAEILFLLAWFAADQFM